MAITQEGTFWNVDDLDAAEESSVAITSVDVSGANRLVVVTVCGYWGTGGADDVTGVSGASLGAFTRAVARTTDGVWSANVYYRLHTGGAITDDTITVSLANAGTETWVSAVATVWAGIDTVDPIGATATGGSPGSTVDTINITTEAANSLILWSGISLGSGSGTPAANNTEIYEATDGTTFYTSGRYNGLPAVGTYAVGWSDGGTDGVSIAAVEIKESTGGAYSDSATPSDSYASTLGSPAVASAAAFQPSGFQATGFQPAGNAGEAPTGRDLAETATPSDAYASAASATGQALSESATPSDAYGASLRLGASISFSATPSVTQNSLDPIYTVDAGGRYLLKNGQPWRIQGEAAWSMMIQLSATEVDSYLADRKAKGLNALLINGIEKLFGTNAPSTYDSIAPFTTPGDFDTPNDTYFERVASYLQKCADAGFAIFLTPCYLGYLATGEGWDDDIASGSNSESGLVAYGTYLAGKIGTSLARHIIWVDGGDQSPTSGGTVETRAHKVLEGIEAALGSTLRCFHGAPDTIGSSQANFNADQDIITAYSAGSGKGLSVPTYSRNAWSDATTRPAFLFESCYENEPVGTEATRAEIRRQFYWGILNSTGGFIFGNRPIWLFDTGWDSSLSTDGILDFQRANNLFSGQPWRLLQPSGLQDSPKTLITSGAGTIGTADYNASASATDGRSAVYYVGPNGTGSRSITIDLTAFTTSRNRARWWDPTDGSWTHIGYYGNTGTQAFSTPGNNASGANDWILLLDAGLEGVSESSTPSTSFASAISSPGSNKDIAESSTPSDAVTGALRIPASLAEGATPSDAQAASARLIRDLSEAATPSDDSAAVLRISASLSESASPAESLSAVMRYAETLSEAAAAADAYASAFAPGGGGITGEVSESTNAAEALSSLQGHASSLSEACSAADAYAAVIVSGSALVEAATPSDASASRQGHRSALSESVSPTDAYERSGAPSVVPSGPSPWRQYLTRSRLGHSRPQWGRFYQRRMKGRP